MRNNMNPQTSHLRLGSRRRGMALLFVVSLILFITLLGTSFVVVSQQFSKTSILRSRIDSRGDSTRPTMNRLFNDLVRGPDPANLQSPFRGGGSLLADMYGYGFSATVDVVAEANYMAPQDPGEYDLPRGNRIYLEPGISCQSAPGDTWRNATCRSDSKPNSWGL